jgi:hypothetical protein
VDKTGDRGRGRFDARRTIERRHVIGLGVIAGLADTFDLHSIPGQGTVMLARFWPRVAPFQHPGSSDDLPESVVGGLTRPISRGQECGDGWAARWTDAGTTAYGRPLLSATPDSHGGTPNRSLPWGSASSSGSAPPTIATGPGLLVMLCDGLGHGPLAKFATQAATLAFHASRGRSPEGAMKDIHYALPGTWGAAVAVARIEPEHQQVLLCGAGNVSAAVVTPNTRNSLPSMPGTAAHQIRTLRTFTLPLPAGIALVMHSDGLTERWNPDTLPALLQHSPTVIAGHLLRGAGKHHDDASVTVAKGPW